ncbi:MAG: UxaA family hydrolase [Candidatus Vecturithrix sp.]|jgi:altronate dehydratase small subunit|nr:UxaA family hydrolase [Candidatus Vecturithrix sp.]
MQIDAIMIKEQDNVATALRDIPMDEKITVGMGDEARPFVVKEFIPYGHKFSVNDIALGENILKYGEVIGRATKEIRAGTHAHIHNIESLRGRGDLSTRES